MAACTAAACRLRARGFTVLELTCCIVIIGILAAVAGPSMFDTHTYKARGYADELAAALHYTQAVAVASGCDAQITINAAGYQALQRARAAGNTCVAAGGFVTPIVRVAGGTLADIPPGGVTTSPASTQIIFNAAGQVSSGTPPPLNITPFTLSVDPVSGLVSVQ